MSKIYVFLADGLEEIEALTPVDLLRRVGDEVVTVSIMGRKAIQGAHDIFIQADVLFEEADFSDADVLILPGGGLGTQNLSAHAGVRAAVQAQYDRDGRVAAICAAPSIFGDMGLVVGKKAVVYPGMEETLVGADVQDVPTVTDGNVTTGHGPGAAMEFGLELVRVLHGEDEAAKLKKALVFIY